MIRFLLLFATVLSGMLTLGAKDSESLRELDRIVARRHTFEGVKKEEIARAKAEYDSATSDLSRYNALRGLYEGYRSFRIDSALIVADERLAIARRLGLSSKIASASINLAESYAKSGLADEAIAILDTLGEQSLEPHHRKYRNAVYRTAYTLKSRTALLPADRIAAHERLRELRDEIASEMGPDSRGYYILHAERLMDAGLPEEAVAKMEEASRKFDFSEDAAMQFTMGEIYLEAGMKEKAIEALANAARIDISSGVKEYRALILLSSLLFEQGDVERAFNYINCAFEDSNFSNAYLRTPEIMEYMPVIDEAFHAYEQEISNRMKVFLWVAGTLVVLLILVSIMLMRTLRDNRRMLSTISDINSRLEVRNRELTEADMLKLHNINMLMMSNARYISRLKDYRKSVYRLMKTGQYDKAMDALKSDRADARDIAAFHEMFDEAFLSMFPDFVEKVNRLLKSPVELKDNRLTPELRVMALMRLGLSSTDEIAGMLQYSPQTVYNLRTSIRSMSRLPKEEFEAEIKKI